MSEAADWLRSVFHVVFFNRKRIDLAVVGTTSSGKSFLLQDIMTVLSKMGGKAQSRVPLYGPDGGGMGHGTGRRWLKNFGSYSPDEFGGSGGTPVYACRQSSFYGDSIKHSDRSLKYDLVFLNIPGEIFMKSPSGVAVRLKSYIALKDEINKMNKRFRVTTWVNDAGDRRYIVTPTIGWRGNPLDVPVVPGATGGGWQRGLKMRYRQWQEIFEDLMAGGFHECKGSGRRINGQKLLRRFFDYDTDSVMMTIRDLLASNQLRDLDFNEDDFNAGEYDKSFTFFHYCARATDIVLCDRLFRRENKPATPSVHSDGAPAADLPPAGQQEGASEMAFGDVAQGLDSFLDDCDEGGNKNVYLAFRNVDFLMRDKENAYKELSTNTLRNMNNEARRNAIYSLFSYAMIHNIDDKMVVASKDYHDFIGLPDDIAETPIDQLTQQLIDLSGGDGVSHRSRDVKDHIKASLGGEGQAFKKLLLRAGYHREEDSDPRSRIIPHIYFTCTPITEDYDIYENYMEGNELAHYFVKMKDGYQYRFDEQFSHACFGSYQLWMDVMTQHGLGDFERGGLLTILADQV